MLPVHLKRFENLKFFKNVCVCLFARECVCVYEIHAHNPVTAKTEKYLLILNLIILMCQFKQDT